MPVKAQEHILYRSLIGIDGGLKSNPTLEVGDVKVSKDGGAFANITTLPTVTPTGGVSVKITLSDDEMNADNVVIVFQDQTLIKEWADTFIEVQTTVSDIDEVATKVDELYKLEGLDISNPVTTTPTSRDAGPTISQVITGDGITTSTVTRT
jgi:hypothetical protein